MCVHLSKFSKCFTMNLYYLSEEGFVLIKESEKGSVSSTSYWTRNTPNKHKLQKKPNIRNSGQPQGGTWNLQDLGKGPGVGPGALAQPRCLQITGAGQEASSENGDLPKDHQLSPSALLPPEPRRHKHPKRHATTEVPGAPTLGRRGVRLQFNHRGSL